MKKMTQAVFQVARMQAEGRNPGGDCGVFPRISLRFIRATCLVLAMPD